MMDMSFSSLLSVNQLHVISGKLIIGRMFVVPVKVDNMSMVKNSSVPESQLKKKSNLVAYHFV